MLERVIWEKSPVRREEVEECVVNGRAGCDACINRRDRQTPGHGAQLRTAPPLQYCSEMLRTMSSVLKHGLCLL